MKREKGNRLIKQKRNINLFVPSYMYLRTLGRGVSQRFHLVSGVNQGNYEAR